MAHVLKSGKQNEILIFSEIVIGEAVWCYYLKEVGQTKIVTTQFHFECLPYFCCIDARVRSARFMQCSSTNTTVIKNRKSSAVFDSENYRFDCIETHFVWAVGHKKYHEKYNLSAEMIAVGSILFKPGIEIE